MPENFVTHLSVTVLNDQRTHTFEVVFFSMCSSYQFADHDLKCGIVPITLLFRAIYGGV